MSNSSTTKRVRGARAAVERLKHAADELTKAVAAVESAHKAIYAAGQYHGHARGAILLLNADQETVKRGLAAAEEEVAKLTRIYPGVE